jgi:hypothetical protein
MFTIVIYSRGKNMQEATGRPHEHGPIITNEVTDIGPVHESL